MPDQPKLVISEELAAALEDLAENPHEGGSFVEVLAKTLVSEFKIDLDEAKLIAERTYERLRAAAHSKLLN